VCVYAPREHEDRNGMRETATAHSEANQRRRRAPPVQPKQQGPRRTDRQTRHKTRSHTARITRPSTAYHHHHRLGSPLTPLPRLLPSVLSTPSRSHSFHIPCTASHLYSHPRSRNCGPAAQLEEEPLALTSLLPCLKATLRLAFTTWHSLLRKASPDKCRQHFRATKASKDLLSPA
jgi:hypothetical protein